MFNVSRWLSTGISVLAGSLFVANQLAVAAESDFPPVYEIGVVSRYLKVGKDENGNTVIDNRRFTRHKFKTLFDMDDRQVQCVLGVHPPEDMNNPGKTPNEISDDNCKTRLLKPGESIALGFAVENYPQPSFRMFLPPGTKEISYMKIFLVQNYPFTVALHLDRPPEVTGCNGDNPHDAKLPCIKGGKIFFSNSDYDKLFQDQDFILEKYVAESVEPKFFDLEDKITNEGHWIYFKVLRNGYSVNGVPVIRKIQTSIKVDGYQYLEWLRTAACETESIDQLIKKNLEVASVTVNHVLEGSVILKQAPSGELMPLIKDNANALDYKIDMDTDPGEIYFVYRFAPKGTTSSCDANGENVAQWYQMRCENDKCMSEEFDRNNIKPSPIDQIQVDLSASSQGAGTYKYYFGIVEKGGVKRTQPFVFMKE